MHKLRHIRELSESNHIHCADRLDELRLLQDPFLWSMCSAKSIKSMFHCANEASRRLYARLMAGGRFCILLNHKVLKIVVLKPLFPGWTQGILNIYVSQNMSTNLLRAQQCASSTSWEKMIDFFRPTSYSHFNSVASYCNFFTPR